MCLHAGDNGIQENGKTKTGSGGSIETRVGSAIGKYERPSEQV